MIWKTDWRPEDNHAREGSSDLDRLLQNYNELKAMLNSEYGFSVSFSTPVTNGYRTLPFQDMLNSVESALNALHVWAVEWRSKVVTWAAGETGPTYEDINRWEQNGWAIEQAAHWLSSTTYYSNEFYSGEHIDICGFRYTVRRTMGELQQFTMAQLSQRKMQELEFGW